MSARPKPDGRYRYVTPLEDLEAQVLDDEWDEITASETPESLYGATETKKRSGEWSIALARAEGTTRHAR